jgi:hypothetical protein
MCWPESDHVVEDQESSDKGTEEEENSAHNITMGGNVESSLSVRLTLPV